MFSLCWRTLTVRGAQVIGGHGPFPSSWRDRRPQIPHMRYAIVIENAGNNFSAYVPDLPGCIATGETLAATEQAIREAIEFHLEGLREDGTPIPPPSSRVDYVEVAA
jgi:predicted RNase H-like HicB family nuclease